jgi:hypothetical protein
LTAIELGRWERVEGSLKRKMRDGDLPHISAVYSIKVPARLEIREWIRTYGPPYITFGGE